MAETMWKVGEAVTHPETALPQYLCHSQQQLNHYNSWGLPVPGPRTPQGWPCLQRWGAGPPSFLPSGLGVGSPGNSGQSQDQEGVGRPWFEPQMPQSCCVTSGEPLVLSGSESPLGW